MFHGLPAVLYCQSQELRLGVGPRGCCRGAMLVPCRVGGNPGKNSFFRETVGTRVQGWGALLTMVDEVFDTNVA